MCSVKPQNDLSHKGQAVEEWADLHFFRPIGIRIARALQPTGISADQVTLWSLVIGLVAGHLFAYQDRWTNVIGFVLFIVSDIFQSGGGAAQPRELAIRRVEDVRDDEEHESDHVGPAVLVGEQVSGDEPDHERPQRHLIRRNPRRLERAGDPDADRPEEVEIGPLLDRAALMREVVLRLHRARLSWWRGRPSPDLRRSRGVD